MLLEVWGRDPAMLVADDRVSHFMTDIADQSKDKKDCICCPDVTSVIFVNQMNFVSRAAAFSH